MKSRTPLPRLSKKKLAALGDKPLPFSTISKPSGSPRTRPKKKRTKSEFARIYGSKARVEFVKSLPCAACGVVGYSENAHIKTGGTGRKSDYTKIVPLCASRPDALGFVLRSGALGCHEMLHRLGRPVMEFTGLDLEKCAEETQLAWASRIQERKE